MPDIKRTAIVLYTPLEMYRLVDDIETYPQFLPWCSAAEEHNRSEDQVEASLALAMGPINKSFTTRNLLSPGKMIEMRLVDGPFHHLEGFWRFDDLAGEGCKVSLDLEFEFANYLVSMAIGPVFQQIAGSLVDAFCKRAVEIYGER